MSNAAMTYDELLHLFEIGANIDETVFYFDDDPSEEEHYIGYLPQYEKPYWAGYCDVVDGCAFQTAQELFTAKIYDGLSIKERWEHLRLVEIAGVPIENWKETWME